MNAEKLNKGIISEDFAAACLKAIGICYEQIAPEESELPIPDANKIILEKFVAAGNSKNGKEAAELEFNLLDEGEQAAALALPVLFRLIAADLTNSAGAMGVGIREAQKAENLDGSSVKIGMFVAELRAIAFCLEEEYLAADILTNPEAKKTTSKLLRASAGDKLGWEKVTAEINLGGDQGLPCLISMFAATTVLSAQFSKVAGAIGECLKHVQVVMTDATLAEAKALMEQT